MKKILLTLSLATSILLADNALKELQENGILIKKDGKTIHIKRDKNELCTEKNLNPKPLFGGDYAGDMVAKACKKTFVTHLGVLQPMTLSKGITTVGEIEILKHIRASVNEPSEYLLIDTRTPQWYEQMTIPTAINIPFNTLVYDQDYDKDDFSDEFEQEEYVENYKRLFKVLSISKTKQGLNFKNSPTLIVFCNASWCSQSPNAIRRLVNLGYPKEKLLWYRGGLQDWLIHGFTAVKP